MLLKDAIKEFTPENINIMLEHLESDLKIESKKEGKGNKTYWYVRRG